MTDTVEGSPQQHERVHDPDALAVIGRVFRVLNRWMAALWRLGLGRWAEVYPPIGDRIVVWNIGVGDPE